jgi:hypothetical protein
VPKQGDNRGEAGSAGDLAGTPLTWNSSFFDDLAGPGVYTLRELVTMTLHLMRKRRLLISVPFAVTEIQARLFELLPNPPLTTGQVDLLKADNVVSGTLPGFRELNINRKRSRRSYRPTSALGHQHRTDWCSEIDDHSPSRFSREDFARQGRHILQSRA